MKKTMKSLGLLLSLLLVSPSLVAQTEPDRDWIYEPTPEILSARKEFQDNKFGIFIHWGVYSMVARGEWALHSGGLDIDEYEHLPAAFYPSKFNAAEWVAAVKACGAKYICFTTRHHDGFSMFHTAESDYNVVDGTPFGRDVLKELADECHKQGIRLHLYYSHIDWFRPDYPLGRTGHNTGRTLAPDWEGYYNFMNRQLTELLTNYGPIGAIWFDGLWDKDQQPGFDWQLEEQYKLVHALQPSCMVANNHHITPYPGEDIQIFERDLPGQNLAGLSGQDISQLPLETCQTMNGMWGYKIQDRNYKSTKELVHLLVRAAGMNGNLLLNVGPRPDGAFPDQALERMAEVGAWMETYGETLYGTRGGQVEPREWGVTTQKGNKTFVHILNAEDTGIFLPISKDKKVKSCVQFDNRTPVRYSQDKDGILLRLDEIPDAIDFVVEIEWK